MPVLSLHGWDSISTSLSLSESEKFSSTLSYLGILVLQEGHSNLVFIHWMRHFLWNLWLQGVCIYHLLLTILEGSTGVPSGFSAKGSTLMLVRQMTQSSCPWLSSVVTSEELHAALWSIFLRYLYVFYWICLLLLFRIICLTFLRMGLGRYLSGCGRDWSIKTIICTTIEVTMITTV